MRTGKEIKDWDFGELASYVREDLLDALFKDGTEGVRVRLYGTFNVIEQWINANGVPTPPKQEPNTIKTRSYYKVACIVTAFESSRNGFKQFDTAMESLRCLGSADVKWMRDDTTSNSEKEAIDQYE